MKRIAYILGAFPVLSETYVATEIRSMIARGHHILPIVIHGDTPPSRSIDLLIAADTVHLDQVPFKIAVDSLAFPAQSAAAGMRFALAQTGLPMETLLCNAARIASLARSEGCSHLHAHFAWDTAAHAIVAARLIGATVSFVGHGHDIYGTPIDLPLKLRASDFTVAVCDDMARDLAAQAPGARIETVPFGIDHNRFRPSDHDLPCNGRLLFVGRLVESKGATDLLAALAQLPVGRRPDLDIIGDGPLAASLRQLVHLLGLASEVKFLGTRSWDWIAEHGCAYAALVAPFRTGSNGDRAAGPTAVREAMAMGLPVVATSFMELKDVVDDSCGFLVPVGNHDALAEALVAAVTLAPEQRRAMGGIGRNRVLTLFNAESQAASLSNLIEAA